MKKGRSRSRLHRLCLRLLLRYSFLDDTIHDVVETEVAVEDPRFVIESMMN
jgi:hypothetical protein